MDVADLKDICYANGITVGDALAARQHRRLFAQACSEHPIDARAMIASETLSLEPIGHLVAEMLVAPSGFSRTSRRVFSALQQLPVNIRWRMGVRVASGE